MRNIPLGKLTGLSSKEIQTKNKGLVGVITEKMIGLKQTTNNLDFDDGELKTNKCKRNIDGSIQAIEPIAIKMLRTEIDNLVAEKPVEFIKSSFWKKMENDLFVSVVKEYKNKGMKGAKALPADKWYISDVHHVRVAVGSKMYNQLQSDYYKICYDAKMAIENSEEGVFHTTNGEIIQFRTKGPGGPRDLPIYSEWHNKNVTLKSYALYYQASGVNDILAGKYN